MFSFAQGRRMSIQRNHRPAALTAAIAAVEARRQSNTRISVSDEVLAVSAALSSPRSGFGASTAHSATRPSNRMASHDERKVTEPEAPTPVLSRWRRAPIVATDASIASPRRSGFDSDEGSDATPTARALPDDVQRVPYTPSRRTGTLRVVELGDVSQPSLPPSNDERLLFGGTKKK